MTDLQIKQMLDELEQAELAEEYPLGSIVTFSRNDVKMVGIVEDIGEKYIVRLMASYNSESGGIKYEPTDEVLEVESQEMELFSEQTKSMPVEVDTKGGLVRGYIDTEDDLTYTVEVYMQHEKKYEPTRIYIRVPKDQVKSSSIYFEKSEESLMCEIKDNVMSYMEEDNVGEIKGMLSPYGNVDSYGDIVEKGAFTQTLSHSGGKTKMFFDHMYSLNNVAGVAYLEDSDSGLMLDGKMPILNTEVKNAYETMKFMQQHGEPLGLSIGYVAVKKRYDSSGFRRLQEVKLKESTITPFPANFEAKIYEVKSRRMMYLAKKNEWQQIITKSEAPQGIRYEEGEALSLLRELKQTIINK